jgi:hypothetical protein
MSYTFLVYQPPLRAWAVPRAVDTLARARCEALEHIVDCYDPYDPHHRSEIGIWRYFELDAQRIPASGGALGPLPDGYVIEVRLISDAEFGGFGRHR